MHLLPNGFRKLAFIGGLCSVLFAGCSASEMPTPSHKSMVAANAAPPGEKAGEAAAPAVARKIIYTSQIQVVVEDLTVAQERLKKLIDAVSKQGGYLSRMEMSGASGSHRSGSWTVRVPLAEFDGFVNEVEKLGELERSSRDAQDVTEAYADLDARIRNKQSSEERLLTHLAKTAELKDTLELERELTRVRGEIEQLQGQLNLLKNKTDLATVTISLVERKGYIPPTKPTFLTQVQQTFDGSLQLLIEFGQKLALIAVAFSPWLAVAVIIALPCYVVLRIRQRRR